MQAAAVLLLYGCISKSISAVAQWTIPNMLRGWEREDIFPIRLAFLPWTPARGPPKHTFWLLIHEEVLTPTPSWASVSLLSLKLADAYGFLGNAWFSG